MAPEQPYPAVSIWDQQTPTQRAGCAAQLAFFIWLLIGPFAIGAFVLHGPDERSTWLALLLILAVLVFLILLVVLPWKFWRAYYAKGRRALERERSQPIFPGVEVNDRESDPVPSTLSPLKLDDASPRQSILIFAGALIAFTLIFSGCIYTDLPIISPVGYIALVMYSVLLSCLFSAVRHTWWYKPVDLLISPEPVRPGDRVTVSVVGTGGRPITHLDVYLSCRHYDPDTEGNSYISLRSAGLVHVENVGSAKNKKLLEFSFPIPTDWPWDEKHEGRGYNVCELRVDQEFGRFTYQKLHYRINLKKPDAEQFS